MELAPLLYRYVEYSPPPGVFNFFLCFSTGELVAIAQYLGYQSEELDPVLQQHRDNKEQQVMQPSQTYGAC